MTVVRTHTLGLPLIPLTKPALYNTDQRVNTALLFSLAAGRIRVSSRCLPFFPCRTGAGAAEVTAPQRGDISFIIFDIRSFFSASKCNSVLKITPIPVRRVLFSTERNASHFTIVIINWPNSMFTDKTYSIYAKFHGQIHVLRFIQVRSGLAQIGLNSTELLQKKTVENKNCFND